MVHGYIITALRDDLSRYYLARDFDSGGCTYWTSSLSDAVLLKTEYEARSLIYQEKKTERFLHSASGACNKTPVREVRILIVPLFTGNALYEEHHWFIITLVAQESLQPQTGDHA